MGERVIAKRQVADRSKALTGHREVNATLGLVKQEPEHIESGFRGPACETKSFLAEVLERKLGVMENRYGKNQLESERNAVLASGAKNEALQTLGGHTKADLRYAETTG